VNPIRLGKQITKAMSTVRTWEIQDETQAETGTQSLYLYFLIKLASNNAYSMSK